MTRWLLRLFTLWTALMTALLPLQAPAQTASDYTQGVSVSGSTATIWFKPTSSTTTWVDVHYNVNGGAQQNYRMTWNATNARHEQVVQQAVASGNVLGYFFTYNKGSPAYDSASYSYTVGGSTGGGTVATPTFGPAGGTYSTAQNVTISTATSGASIRYTTDGSTPTASSALYGGPVTVSGSVTLKALALKSGMTNSAVATAAYTITQTVASTPVITPGGGAYSAAQTVSISSATSGATIHYTTDGSAPNASSPTYTGSFLVSASKSVRAVAMKSGLADSAFAEADYDIGVGTWNKQTTFNFVNGTGGAYPDSQVYWAMIGMDWNTGKFVHVNSAGQLVPMSAADNGALSKGGVTYTNYFTPLSTTKSITIPPINSARLYLSVGSPMYIRVNQDVAGNIGYTGPNIENSADPNIDVIFDFVEMAIVPTAGYFGNTTRVDQFGFPVKMRVQGLGGYDRTVGETESRAAIMSAWQNEVPTQFKGLANSYRIVAPAHASFNNGGANATYLDSYIAQMWNQYTTQNLVFTDAQGTFTGHVSGGKFIFTDGAGTYTIQRAPTTAEALLGNGVLNDATGQTPGTPGYDKQLQIQAQMCAAINRHVVNDPAHWSNSNFFYPAGTAANWFAKFWHTHNVGQQSYGFAYDDVGNFSSSLHTPAPTVVTTTIGW